MKTALICALLVAMNIAMIQIITFLDPTYWG